MERIELFDHYISGTLSTAEAEKFKNSLDTDSDFATEFEVYLLTVRGICQEAEQENIEFGHAMKSLSKTQLLSIIGKKDKSRTVRSYTYRERMIWISSIAAMLVIAIGIGWGFYTSSRNQLLLADNNLCDVIYSYNYQPVGSSRSDGREYVNLNNLTDEQIKALIPEIIATFEADETDSQDWHIDGMTLAMAYLKLHQKDKAVMVLKNMASKTKEPDEYNRLVEQLK